MSAWIVSKKHIDALVSAARMDKLFSFYHKGKRIYINSVESCDWIGNELTKENRRSINFRYREETKPSKYEFDFNLGWSPIAIIKNCHCYSYQTCEHNEWESSVSHAFIKALAECMVSEVAGYEAAPWGIDSKKSNAVPISYMGERNYI